MQQNILRNSDVTKIYLIYSEKGLKKKFLVTLRFMDSKEGYFSIPFKPGFEKPKRKTPADLVVYTPDGVYKSSVLIVDATLSMQEMLFQVTIPVIWNFSQLRESSRKIVSIPVKIKYNDGYEIINNSYDLAVGGVSIYSDEHFSSIYKSLPCIVELEIPGGNYVNIGGTKIVVEGKFVREKEGIDEHFGKFLYVFKFTCKKDEEKEYLKNYLISLEWFWL